MSPNLEETKEPFCAIVPHPVLENEKWKVYWVIAIQTDKMLANKRPDVVLHNNEEKEAFFDIAHLNDNNVEKAEREKLFKKKVFFLCQKYKTIHKLKKVSVVPVAKTTSGIIGINMLK